MALTLLLFAMVAPITSVAEMPPIDRLAPDFYGAIGDGRTGVEAVWNAEWDGSDIALTLTIKNAINPTELTAPDLPSMQNFKERFQFLDEETRFSWRLRQRGNGTVEIPSLKMRYYVPGLPEGQRFRTTYAKSATLERPLTVENIDPRFTIEPLQTTSSDIALSIWTWLIVVGLVPAFVLLWIGIDRRLFPDRAKLRRNQAVRVALDQLVDAKRQPDEAERVSVILWRYCVDRHHLSATNRTPSEIADGLHNLDCDYQCVVEMEQLLQACDAARFNGAIDSPLSLTDEARRLICRWETVS